MSNIYENNDLEKPNKVWFEPTDSHRASKPFTSKRWHYITYISPNINELQQIHFELIKNKRPTPVSVYDLPINELIQECITLCIPIIEHIPCIILTLDKNGILIVRSASSSDPLPTTLQRQQSGNIKSAIHYLAPNVNIRNVSGAGDCLAGTMIAGIMQNRCQEDCILAGLHAAALSLQCQANVPDSITLENVFNTNREQLQSQYYSKIIRVT